MTLKMKTARIIAIAGLAVTGNALAQMSVQPSVTSLTSPDGDPLVQKWDVPVSKVLMLGLKGQGSSASDLDPVFIPAGTSPEADSHAQAVYLPNGSGVVVANRISKNLTIFDPNTRALIKAIPLSGSPNSVAITPDGTRAITANMFEGTASIVNLTTGVETAVLPAGPSPCTARISPSGNRAIVHSGGVLGVGGPGKLSVINMAASSVERVIDTQVPVSAFGINFEALAWYFKADGAVIASESTAVFPNFYDDTVDIINLDTGTVTPITVGDGPRGIAIYAGGTRAAVSVTGGQAVSVIDIPGASAIANWPTGIALDGPICVSGDGTKAVVAVLNACRVVNLSTGAMSANLATATVNQLITTADGNHALCVGFSGNLISFTSQTIVKTLNQFVAASVGAVSPVGTQAAMFSDTFGEDMVIVSTHPTSGALLSAGPTGPAPEADKSRTIALVPNNRAVVVNQFSQTASVIDIGTNTVLATLPTGRRGGAVAAYGNKAVVSARDGTYATVIDTDALTSVDINTANRGDQIAIAPNGQWAYIAHVSPDVVSRINLTNFTAGGTLPAGNMGGYFQHYNSFSGLAISPDSQRLVTCNSFDNTLTVIDTFNWQVIQTLPLGPGATFPIRATYSKDGSKIFVSNRDSSNISVVNTGASYTVAGTIGTGAGPTEMAHLKNGPQNQERVYVITSGTTPNAIDVIDVATLSKIDTISFGGNETIDAISFGPTEQLTVARSNGAFTFGAGALKIEQSGFITRVDTETHDVIDEVAIGHLSSSMVRGLDVAVSANLMSEGISVVSFDLLPGCYPDCDGSGFLDIDDFICFQTLFALGEGYPDCDLDEVLTIDDFICFQTLFAIGC